MLCLLIFGVGSDWIIKKQFVYFLPTKLTQFLYTHYELNYGLCWIMIVIFYRRSTETEARDWKITRRATTIKPNKCGNYRAINWSDSRKGGGGLLT